MKNIEKENAQREIKLGHWKFSADYGITSSPEGKKLVIEPRLAKLLYFLSLNVNNIVSRNYLIENIWPDTVVNEESLTKAIADLRKLLASNFDDTFSLETIRKRGYQLSLETTKVYSLKFKLNPSYLYSGLFLITIGLVVWLWAL
jgi:DNA-binding winged helix-turn-helix (wHTH) protein